MFFKTFAEKQREQKGDRYDADMRKAKGRISALHKAAQKVCSFDWSAQPPTIVAAIEALRKELK